MQAAQQHDLIPAAAARILDIVRVRPGETVVEVGAGLGALTAGMLAAGATVHGIERDPQRLAHLTTRFAEAIAAGRLFLHGGDALRWRARLPAGWRVVANPPFNLTAPLVHRWLIEEAEPPIAIDLVLQREAAQKLTPPPLPRHGRAPDAPPPRPATAPTRRRARDGWGRAGQSG